MGVVVRALPPIVRPTERITQVTVPGRHGKLIMTEGDAPVYDNYVKTIDCYVRPDVDIEALLDWLRGSGRVIFSNEPDRAYTARIYSQISLEKIMRGHRHRAFAVSFLCDPVKGQAIPDPPVSVDLTESHARLYNPGNIPAKPLIAVTAVGAFSLIVGAVLITNGGISYYGDPDGTHTFTMASTTGETASEATVLIDADGLNLLALHPES